MNRMKVGILVLAIMIILYAVPRSYSATYTLYNNLSDFTTAANPLFSQNFNSYTTGQSVNGIDFFPGVNVTSNMSNVQIHFNKNVMAFDASTRQQGNAYYQVNLSSLYMAAGFDIVAWETAPGSADGAIDNGMARIYFADNTFVEISLTQPASSASVFFGVVADTPLMRIQWYEPHETSGGNEETALDNFVVGKQSVATPVPPSVWLLGSGLLGLVGLRGRFRKYLKK